MARVKKLRPLELEEIERLANRPGVKRTAVENFLMTVEQNETEDVAIANLHIDARRYRWNRATIKAIHDGIQKATTPKPTSKSQKSTTTRAKEVEELKRLRDMGIISEETYQEALPKAQEIAEENKRLDIYNNRQGELCIIFRYGQRQWNIRIPLLYNPWQYLKEHYPINDEIANIKGQKTNRALWRAVTENRELINRLDCERKEKIKEVV